MEVALTNAQNKGRHFHQTTQERKFINKRQLGKLPRGKDNDRT